MAQLNDLLVTGAARFINSISGTADKAVCDGNGSNIASAYMKKGKDRVTAGQKAGTTLGTASTAEGYNTTASKSYSHAEGYETTASGSYSHAEGYGTGASGSQSHAEGSFSIATANTAHAEGYGTNATASAAHSEGERTTASGSQSHAEGTVTTASTSYSHAEGEGTSTNIANQFVCGSYNSVPSVDSYFVIGNGTSSSAKNNAFTVSAKGMITLGYTNGVVPSTYQAASNTVPNLINELRVLNGAMGSVYLTSAYTLGSATISAGWYCFISIPMGTGGIDGGENGDNTKNGNIIFFGMNSYNAAYKLRYNNSAATYLTKFV